MRLGIANNRIGVRTFEIAGIEDQKQLANAIRFRAQETLPIPIDEAVLDYQVLGEGVGEDGQPTKRVLLVVAYRELIDRYVDACKKAGITLVGIDLEAFALLRALQAPQEGVGTDAAAALVVVAIGHERSTFAVSDGRVCEFTRVLEWGGSALNVAIARAVDAAPSEVEATKRALSLMDEMVPDGITADQAKAAREAMRRAIQTFARELVSSLQYYQNQPGSLGIGEIVLTGGTAHLPGLAGELERLIGVHVRVGDPLARMKVSKKVGQPEQIGSLAVAIGLGIEDYACAPSTYCRENRRSARSRRRACRSSSARCAGVLVAAVLGAMFMMGSGKVAAQQRKVDDLNRTFQALPPPPAGPSAAQQQLAGEQSARVSALSAALTSRVAWDRVFREFSLVLPEDVWLTTLSAKSPISPLTNVPSSTGGRRSQFTIQGRTYSHDGVARLLRVCRSCRT